MRAHQFIISEMAPRQIDAFVSTEFDDDAERKIMNYINRLVQMSDWTYNDFVSTVSDDRGLTTMAKRISVTPEVLTQYVKKWFPQQNTN